MYCLAVLLEESGGHAFGGSSGNGKCGGSGECGENVDIDGSGDGGGGASVAQTMVEAAQWYRRAAEQGHAPAMRSLGLLLAAGRGVELDFAEAVNWSACSCPLRHRRFAPLN